jgi:SAM-dependent methyltransferase
VLFRSPLPFADNEFDLGFSNAVIEHVGSRERQAAFLAELVRVASRVFISTPNRFYPLELHTRLPLLHWLPPRLFRSVLARLGMDFYSREENLNLLTARELKGMLPPGPYRVRLFRHYFLGLPSNLILIVEKP